MNSTPYDERSSYIFRKCILAINNHDNIDNNILLGSRPHFVHLFFDYFKKWTILDYDDIKLFDNTENILAYVDQKNNIFFVERKLLIALRKIANLHFIGQKYFDEKIIETSLLYLEKSTLCMALNCEYINGVVIKLKCTNTNIFILTDNGNFYTICIQNESAVGDILKPTFKLSLLDVLDFEICCDLSIIYKQFIIDNKQVILDNNRIYSIDNNNRIYSIDIDIDNVIDIDIDIDINEYNSNGEPTVIYDNSNNNTTFNSDGHDIYNGNEDNYYMYNDDGNFLDDDDSESSTFIIDTNININVLQTTQNSKQIYVYKMKDTNGIISTLFESKFDMKIFTSKSFITQKIVVFACEKSLNNFYLPERSRAIFPIDEIIMLANGFMSVKVIFTCYNNKEIKKLVRALIVLSNKKRPIYLNFSYEHFEKIKKESKFNSIYMYFNNENKKIFYICKSHSDDTLKFYSILVNGNCETFVEINSNDTKNASGLSRYEINSAYETYPSYRCLKNSKIIENQIDLNKEETTSIKYLLRSTNLTKWLIYYIWCIKKKLQYYIPLFCIDMILHFISKSYFFWISNYYNNNENNIWISNYYNNNENNKNKNLKRLTKNNSSKKKKRQKIKK